MNTTERPGVVALVTDALGRSADLIQTEIRLARVELGEKAEALIPAVDIFEDSNGITLRADLPGVSRDRLDIQVEDDTLTIAGPALALVLGSGFEGAVAEMRLAAEIPFSKLPGFPLPAVPGHAGRRHSSVRRVDGGAADARRRLRRSPRRQRM